MKVNNNISIILAVDDDESILETFKIILEDQFIVVTANSGEEALKKIEKELIDMVFLDYKMPGMDGMNVLRKIKEYDENLPVVMATATDSARTAVEAIQLGACNYITKPFDPDEILTLAEESLEKGRYLKEAAKPRRSGKKSEFDNIIGKSKQMQAIFDMLNKVLDNDATILISGESGTGKELIAQAIHFNSLRNKNSFIPINCASIPENLLESELFGHEKGAFTDAARQKIGIFELADKGTLFLDEISCLKPDMQAKFLRVLEQKEVQRVGGNKIIKVDVRIISATNIDLKRAIEEGSFRNDLYYRLNVVPIHLPTLRERREDIPLLIEHFLNSFNEMFGKEIRGITPEALECMMNYDWPGNVRELKNIVERLVALKEKGVITPKELPLDIFLKHRLVNSFRSQTGLKDACNDFERNYIESVLEQAGGSQIKAAKMLGIHRNALFNKMKSLGLKGDK
ncbi:MAG: sigma-54 dependent transcriptional regulator [Candidatus Omnitrophota bacterium]